jgi:hypothetical protein
VNELLRIALIAILGFNAILLIVLAVRYLAAKEEEFFSKFSESAADPPPDILPPDPYVLKNGSFIRTNIPNPE